MNEQIEWLKQRQQGIGGSDCAAVLGISRWKTPLQVYNDKINEVKKIKETEAMYFGHLLEKIVIDEYSRRTNNECIINNNQICRSEKYPWLLATIDAQIKDQPLILEAKTTRFFNEEWGNPGTDEIPEEYLIQCAHYCLILSEIKMIVGADIAVLGSTNDYRIYHYKRNKKLEEQIVNITHDFWHRYILQKKPPPITSQDSAKLLYQKALEQSVEVATSEISELCDQLTSLKQNVKIHDEHIKQLQNEIQLYMKDKEILIDISGHKLATWKNQERKILDTKKIKETDVDLYNKYSKKIDTRVFKIY